MCGLILVLMLDVPESPRWLLAKGRKMEANEVIKKIAHGMYSTNNRLI